MIVWTLWVLTSAYIMPMGTYAEPRACAALLIATQAFLDKPPRAFIAKVMCIPTAVSAAPRTREGGGRIS